MTFEPVTSNPYVIIFSVSDHPGCLGVVAKESNLNIIKELEINCEFRKWHVRGIISDHIRLAGTIQEVIEEKQVNMIRLNSDVISIYLHHGGLDAVYFDLVSKSDGTLKYIETIVETDLPSNAFGLARAPLNELLDNIATAYNIPLVLERLDLVSPLDGRVLAHEINIPFNTVLQVSPFGGIHQHPAFSPIEALFREGITTASPYYRILCAFRMYDGIKWLRKWIKDQCQNFEVNFALPKDLPINVEELKGQGIKDEFLNGIRTANDLFGKFTPQRDAIAHFLLNRDGSHVYMGRSENLIQYSLLSTVLLYYAYQAFSDLRDFSSRHLEQSLLKGSILPRVEDRDRFNIKDQRLIENTIKEDSQ